MTNEQIQEASKLIGEIGRLEKVKFTHKDALALARRTESSRMVVLYHESLDHVTDVPLELAKEVLETVITRKKARLNDLRAGC